MTEACGVPGKAGRRNLLRDEPVVAEAVRQPWIAELVVPILGPGVRCVGALLFDKTGTANWGVSWHQDLSLAVSARLEVSGFSGWSVKQGVLHAQASAEMLEQMLTLRLFLDPCGPGNGPLRVIPGSHSLGRLDDDGLRRCLEESGETACTGEAGDVLLMRPLLLHASSRAVEPTHRRVLHLEFAAGFLPGGLKWHDAADTFDSSGGRGPR